VRGNAQLQAYSVGAKLSFPSPEPGNQNVAPKIPASRDDLIVGNVLTFYSGEGFAGCFNPMLKSLLHRLIYS